MGQSIYTAAATYVWTSYIIVSIIVNRHIPSYSIFSCLLNKQDCWYQPLDPKDIRLPPPQPPSERLLKAVEEFYMPPSRDKPRDAEGWEKLGLFEFYKLKEKYKERGLRRPGERGESRCLYRFIVVAIDRRSRDTH